MGALPDMMTLTPNGEQLLVANEGQPRASYLFDPEGSIAIIDMTKGAAALTNADVTIAGFTAFNAPAAIDPRIRIFGPGASVAQDLEPEFIAVSHDSKTAWVTLQENNALAIVDLKAKAVTDLVALGFKNHSVAGNGLDPSDQDGGIHIANWPVLGMYLPDAIGALQKGNQTFLVTANEGDTRDYSGFSEVVRINNASVVLDPTVFTNAATLKLNANLGRLNITNTRGKVNGKYTELYAFGGRSFSVWSSGGSLIFDSGDDLEQQIAHDSPSLFNANHNGATGNTPDTRSDDKGPEPEGLTIENLSGATTCS